MKPPATDPASRLAQAREGLLQRDYRRLLRHGGRGAKIDPRWEQDLARSLQRAAQRATLRPASIDYPPDLPVSQARAELLDAIRENQVIVVCGETGSGKTTQLPKLCLELGRGSRGFIGHTQPRRLAARSVAQRIARELGGDVGGLVGCETRFDRRVSERTLVKLMTDGILLAELQRDHPLDAYDTIIIDEAHERSLNIDFLLGWLKVLLPQRPDLKVIVTSATLDPERLSRHFGNAPIVNVQGRMFPVETRYREPSKDDDLEDGVASAVDELWRSGRPGDILVFLPGEREIHDLSRSLPGRFPYAEVLPLYSRLPAAQQDRVFTQSAKARIVLSTNVAETSVTVPGIRYVVDSGTARINRFSPRLGVQQLQIEPIAQASANQRAGRCGRLGPGVCIRLYAEDDFGGRPLFTDPEILRSNLAGVILQMTALDLGEIETFPWLDAPEHRHIADGYRLLQTIGALDDERLLTPLGRELARLPLDPRVARIAVAGRGTPCEDEVRVLAAALSVQDPHDMPPDAQDAARAAHATWRHPKSDFMSLLNLWARWRQWSEASSNRQLRKLCRDNFVSYLRLEEWESVYRQIVDLLRDREAPRDTVRANTDLEALYPAIHKCLLAGLIDHVGVKLPEKPEFTGPRGRRFRIFPGSALAKKPPPWVMSATLAQTSQLFARTNAAVEPEWLAEVGSHLVRRVLHDPTWNPVRGEVTAHEHVSLLGLPLLKRVRHYGSDEPREARTIFIREALVRGDWQHKPAFLQGNLALIEEIRDVEARLRRPDLLADEAQLFAFYDARVPADVCTTAGLKAWFRRGVTEPALAPHPSSLTMSAADALRPGASLDVESSHPDHREIGGVRIALSYTHDPGADADGVTFHIPLAQLFRVDAQAFDWLVPGLLPARIEALIRTLPHALRRQCSPAATYADAIANSLPFGQGELLGAICARFRAMIGMELQPSDFAPADVDAWLAPRLLLEDDSGAMLDEARSLAELQTRHAGGARAALNRSAQADDGAARWMRQDLRDWDFGDLPDEVRLNSGAVVFPALEAADDRIDLRLFESQASAQAAHAAGVRALLLLRMPERLRDFDKRARTLLALPLSAQRLAPERVARDIAQRVADAVLLTAPIRTAAAFQQALEQRARFSTEGLRRLDELGAWLQQAAELRKAFSTVAAWRDAHADLREQLDSLFAEGFLASIPEARWARIAVYLRAMRVRIERLPNKPQRDAELMAQVRRASARLPSPFHPARWLIEEWRVALFAQELKALDAPGAAKIEAALKVSV